MQRLILTLFGGYEARLGSGPVLTLPTRKVEALLAYLALPPGQAHLRDKLAALLWGEVPDLQARASLRQALFTLRQALPGAEPARLRLDGQAVALNPAAVEVDVTTFETCLGEGTPEGLDTAARLYRGDLLAGTPGRGGAVRGMAPGRARAPAGAGDRGAGAAPGPPAQGGVDRGGAPDGAAPGGAGSSPGGCPPDRHAALRSARPPRGGAFPVPAVRGRAPAGARCGAGGGDPAAPPGDPPAASRAPRHGRTVAFRHPAETAGPRARTRDGLQRGPGWCRPPGLAPRAHGHAAHRPGDRAGSAARRARGRPGRSGPPRHGARRGRRRKEPARGRVGPRVAPVVGCRVLFGRAWELERILPFAPWVAALRDGGIGRESQVVESLSPVWRAELARLLPEVADAEDRPPPQRARPPAPVRGGRRAAGSTDRPSTTRRRARGPPLGRRDEPAPPGLPRPSALPVANPSGVHGARGGAGRRAHAPSCPRGLGARATRRVLHVGRALGSRHPDARSGAVERSRRCPGGDGRCSGRRSGR